MCDYGLDNGNTDESWIWTSWNRLSYLHNSSHSLHFTGFSHFSLQLNLNHIFTLMYYYLLLVTTSLALHTSDSWAFQDECFLKCREKILEKRIKIVISFEYESYAGWKFTLLERSNSYPCLCSDCGMLLCSTCSLW